MDEPTENTSNYGWALWHLMKADDASRRGVPDGVAGCARDHIAMAQVRATLQACNRDVDGTTWATGRDRLSSEAAVWPTHTKQGDN